MAAYAKKHTLSAEQTDMVRKELSLFIDQLSAQPSKGSKSEVMDNATRLKPPTDVTIRQSEKSWRRRLESAVHTP